MDLETGRASYAVRDLALRDYTNIPNALSGANAPFSPTVVSFRIEWHGTTPLIQIGDPTLHFAARVRENTATMEWRATTNGVTFVSDPASASHSVFAEIGHERNGVFFDSRLGGGGVDSGDGSDNGEGD